MLSNHDLSERELEILKLVSQGASNKEIARQLFISNNTVKVHLRNIFTKVGVTSRTEAAMYAVNAGLVETTTPSRGKDKKVDFSSLYQVDRSPLKKIKELLSFGKHPMGMYALLFIALLVLILIWSLVDRSTPQTIPTTDFQPLVEPLQRWTEKTSLPTPRKGMAVVTYENLIYTIGGESETGVTNVLELYDPVKDTWVSLAAKPISVTEASAAVIGGLIFVPGGKQAVGLPSAIMEVYDPLEDKWQQRATLPTSLSAYAMVAYEGRLYLFGGWDGEEFVDTVYIYDPIQDKWNEKSSLPSRRGYSAAALVGDKIYLFGGFDGTHVLSTVDIYMPNRDDGFNNPWNSALPLPQGVFRASVAVLTDIFYLAGGMTEQQQPMQPLELNLQENAWRNFKIPANTQWANMALAPTRTSLYAFGGEVGDTTVGFNWHYQAIYTILFPVIK